jgi:hypothetical protein
MLKFGARGPPVGACGPSRRINRKCRVCTPAVSTDVSVRCLHNWRPVGAGFARAKSNEFPKKRRQPSVRRPAMSTRRHV